LAGRVVLGVLLQVAMIRRLADHLRDLGALGLELGQFGLEGREALGCHGNPFHAEVVDVSPRGSKRRAVRLGARHDMRLAMRVTPYPITAYGLACGLGRDTAAVLDKLRRGERGLSPVPLDVPFETVTGTIPGPLPE